jgi:predicted permease
MRWYQRFFRRGLIEKHLDAELRFHLDQRIADLVATGIGPEEACRRARLEFGGLDRVKEECRDVGAAHVLETLIQDLRYGLRQLRRSPGFTLVAVATLALGIGANTAMFSVVNSVLLRPLPFLQPDRIVQILKQYKDGTGSSVSVPLFNYWRDHNQVFENVTAFGVLPIGLNLANSGEAERVPGVRVMAGFFRVLGIQPALGREFLREEDSVGGPHAVVLSNGLWQRRFAGDTNLLGHPITINGEKYTVVGVMPPGFDFPSGSDFSSGTELWIPFRLPKVSRDPANFLVCIARLRPGTSQLRAQTEMSRVTQEFHRAAPDLTASDERATLVPLHERLVGPIRPALLILLGAVGLVLLIACANVANLFIAKSNARIKELAIRTALGASRFRVTRQLLTEAVLLSLLGGLLGLALGFAAVPVLTSLGPSPLPRQVGIVVDWRILAFTLVVSLFTGILFGLVPARSVTRTSVEESLREGCSRLTAGVSARRFSAVLIAVETGLSLVLLIGAALLIQSFSRLLGVDPGFDARHLLTFETTLPEGKYGTPEKFSAFVRATLQRLQALPGVEAAAAVTCLPTQFGPDFPFVIEGRTGAGSDQDPGDSQYRVISPDYFQSMRIPLLGGRYFTEGDSQNSQPVAIINATMARQFWAKSDPIGQQFIINKPMGPDWTEPPRVIVGVVGDVRESSLSEQAPPEMFVPYGQVPAHMAPLLIREIPPRWVVRVKGSPLSLAADAKRAVLEVDPDEPIAHVASMEQVLFDSLGRWRFNMILLGAFAALALVLASIGIYGVLSHSVSQRVHEIGVRMALGAERGEVMRLVVGQGMATALIGIGAGLAAAVGLTSLLSSMLYAVRPTDLPTFVASALTLAAVSLMASYIPARRATIVDPMLVLRHE